MVNWTPHPMWSRLTTSSNLNANRINHTYQFTFSKHAFFSKRNGVERTNKIHNFDSTKFAYYFLVWIFKNVVHNLLRCGRILFAWCLCVWFPHEWKDSGSIVVLFGRKYDVWHVNNGWRFVCIHENCSASATTQTTLHRTWHCIQIFVPQRLSAFNKNSSRVRKCVCLPHCTVLIIICRSGCSAIWQWQRMRCTHTHTQTDTSVYDILLH